MSYMLHYNLWRQSDIFENWTWMSGRSYTTRPAAANAFPHIVSLLSHASNQIVALMSISKRPMRTTVRSSILHGHFKISYRSLSKVLNIHQLVIIHPVYIHYMIIFRHLDKFIVYIQNLIFLKKQNRIKVNLNIWIFYMINACVWVHTCSAHIQYSLQRMCCVLEYKFSHWSFEADRFFLLKSTMNQLW